MSRASRPSPSGGRSSQTPSRGKVLSYEAGPRVLVVERDAMARLGQTHVLAAGSALRVTGSVAGIDDAEYLPASTPVDVVLAGGDILAMDLPEGIDRLLTRFVAARVVLLSSDLSPASILSALRAGADGYLSRDLPIAALVRSVQGVTRGETALSRAHLHVVVTALRTGGDLSTTLDQRASLSPRERDVAAEICRGRSNTEIATDLGLKESTVKTHVSSILRKTGCRSRFALLGTPLLRSASA